MALLTAQPMSGALNYTLVSQDDGQGNVEGDTFVNTGHEVVYIRNDHAFQTNSVVVTVPTPCKFGIVHDAHNVLISADPLGATTVIGPFPKEKFNDASGLVKVTCFASTQSTYIAIVKR